MAVPGNVYDRYNAEEVIGMLELNEPMHDGSDDDLDLDIGSGDDER